MSKRIKNIVIICVSVFIFASIALIVLLILDIKNQPFKISFTTVSDHADDYLITFQTGIMSEEDAQNSGLGFYDMDNLVIGNSLNLAYCRNQYCPKVDSPESIDIEISNAIYQVYDLKEANLEIHEVSISGEKQFLIYDPVGYKQIAYYSTMDSLIEYFDQYLMTEFNAPSNLSIKSPDQEDRPYQIEFHTDYMEFYQHAELSNCSIAFGFDTGISVGMYDLSSSASLSEECNEQSSTENLNFKIYVSSNSQTIIEITNSILTINGNQSLRNSNDHHYFIVLSPGDEDILFSALDNNFDLYTRSFGEDIITSQIYLPESKISLNNVPGTLIYGKNQYNIPPYSTLEITSTDNSITQFYPYELFLENNLAGFSMLTESESNEIILNGEPMTLTRREQFEKIRSTITPILSVILSGSISCVIGIIIGNKENTSTGRPGIRRRTHN